MSVKKLWLAGDKECLELTADTTSNPLDPVGAVRSGEKVNGPVLDKANLCEGLVQAIRVAALCKVAT